MHDIKTQMHSKVGICDISSGVYLSEGCSNPILHGFLSIFVGGSIHGVESSWLSSFLIGVYRRLWQSWVSMSSLNILINNGVDEYFIQKQGGILLVVWSILPCLLFSFCPWWDLHCSLFFWSYYPGNHLNPTTTYIDIIE